MVKDLRKLLLQKQPLLPFIEEAIDRYRRGVAEPVRNPEDGQEFNVEFDNTLAVLKVIHDGRVVYRSRHAKNSDSGGE